MRNLEYKLNVNEDIIYVNAKHNPHNIVWFKDILNSDSCCYIINTIQIVDDEVRVYLIDINTGEKPYVNITDKQFTDVLEFVVFNNLANHVKEDIRRYVMYKNPDYEGFYNSYFNGLSLQKEEAHNNNYKLIPFNLDIMISGLHDKIFAKKMEDQKINAPWTIDYETKKMIKKGDWTVEIDKTALLDTISSIGAGTIAPVFDFASTTSWVNPNNPIIGIGGVSGEVSLKKKRKKCNNKIILKKDDLLLSSIKIQNSSLYGSFTIGIDPATDTITTFEDISKLDNDISDDIKMMIRKTDYLKKELESSLGIPKKYFETPVVDTIILKRKKKRKFRIILFPIPSQDISIWT